VLVKLILEILNWRKYVLAEDIVGVKGKVLVPSSILDLVGKLDNRPAKAGERLVEVPVDFQNLRDGS
jgi:hypothetical protein